MLVAIPTAIIAGPLFSTYAARWVDVPVPDLFITEEDKAGGDKADPLVRYVVDDEFGDVAHKEKSFADKVMFWRGLISSFSSPSISNVSVPSR